MSAFAGESGGVDDSAAAMRDTPLVRTTESGAGDYLALAALPRLDEARRSDVSTATAAAPVSHPPTISAAHLQAEERAAGAPLIGGNQVTLLNDGPATYAAMLEAIGKARRYILLESYILDNDAIGARFAQALTERSRAGVSVALMVDALGTLSTPDEYFDALAKAGVKIVHFNSLNPVRASFGWNINERNHRKVLVVDGSVGFTGGLNLSEVYSSRPGSRAARPKREEGSAEKDAPWRDTHVRIVGPAAMELQRSFLEGWTEQGGEALPATVSNDAGKSAAMPGKDQVRIVTTSPDESSAIYWTLLAAIAGAQSSVHITMAYFVPNRTFRDALSGAARRGIDVKLILPGFSDFWMVFHAGRAHYTELLESGVRIYERHDALLHAKTAVIDGVWSTVGSSNIDWRSFVHNYELNAVVLGASFGTQMEALFEKDRKVSVPVTLDDWLERSWTLIVRERVALLFSYWL